ncbi:hypothetical protein GFC01_16795 [Desulfofundulus thermobenzoicus]|uniref:Uncharacterized protein n=1 Tax=Desulfofundulus thermobenzoicus TaxID=29376 RepID=A0A6N7IWA4_9FIRM|nr:hypothetical protein [Desulfofundulus thermobenzoicus]MQL53883.1 hypothetical protein [Desulfofundulus thermobenzoicus]
MARVEIYGGICGFNTTVQVAGAGGRKVKITLESECPNWQKAAEYLREYLKEVDAYKEVFGKLHESETYRLYAPFIPHPACLVPAGIVKAIEVAAGLALPRDGVVKVINE